MIKRIGWLCILACGLLASPADANGLTAEQRAEVVQILRQALHDDPSILRDAMATMQADDAARRDLATRSTIAAQHQALLADPADAVAGNPAGNVTVVEFYDPRCPYCRQMLPVMSSLLQSDPQIRLVFKDIPILGPASVLEAKALLAAQRQGAYLPYQQAIMHDTATPTVASLRAEAEREGLDGARFERDLADPAIQARLDDNLSLAAALHVEGTPALVVGDQMIPGAIDLPELQRAVAAARLR